MPLSHRVTFVLMACLLLLLAACARPTPSPSVPTSSSPGSATAIPSTPPSSGTPGASSAPTDPPPLAIEAVAQGFIAPIGLASGPPGWLLVQEQAGRVVALETATGATAVALDITDRVLGGGERGLLGLALHPDFPAEPRAFVHYSDRDGHTVLSEFGVSRTSGPIAIDPGSERMLLRVEQPFANHNGGQLAFGPDGYLWLGLGDGGSGGDPLGHGQNPATLLGSILRIDVDDIPDDGNDAIGYGIPDDNPFADGTTGAPEVYLYGLRNPWRFSFDRGTDLLWIADVGQDAFEEVSRVDPVAEGGGNLGWNLMEASGCYVAGCSPDGLILPVAEYGRDLGCSITGGHVYRGDGLEDLSGWYLFSDYCSGLLFGVRAEVPSIAAGQRAAAPRVLLETGANVSSFGEAADGELYLTDHASGTVYRIVAGG